jgi:hypothetical protein
MDLFRSILMSRANELIRALLATYSEPDHEALANDLLHEYGSGHPIETLRPLLRSPHTEVVGVAMFVVSELGRDAALLLNDVANLLHHPDVGIRFDVIDSILTCASASDGDKIAPVAILLDDPDRRIRWQAMKFLSLASVEQLRAAMEHLQEHQPDSLHIPNLQWLYSESASNIADVNGMIGSTDPLFGKYGVIAGARIGCQNKQPLLHASASEDTDIKTFAESMLTIMGANQ